MARPPFAGLRRWFRTRSLPGLPRIVAFRCEQSVALHGGSFTLAWDVVGPAVVTLEPALGDVPLSGRVRVPAMTDSPTTWVLVASARGGTVCQVLARPPVLAPAALLHAAALLRSEEAHIPLRLPRAARGPIRQRRLPRPRAPLSTIPTAAPASMLRVVPAIPEPDVSSAEHTA